MEEPDNALIGMPSARISYQQPAEPVPQQQCDCHRRITASRGADISGGVSLKSEPMFVKQLGSPLRKFRSGFALGTNLPHGTY